jgi:hypothetical protein
MESKVVICICGYCHKDFARKKENISRSLKPRPNKKFCSKTCHALYNNTSVEKPCGYCMATVTRTLAEFKSSKSGKIFCNSSCAATYSNSHKTHGTRVSKLENFIKSAMLKGYTLDKISEALQDIGWKKEIVDSTINKYKTDEQSLKRFNT